MQAHFVALLALVLSLFTPLAYAAPATVVSIAASQNPVAAGDTLSLTVTYNKAMDTTVNPVFSFPTTNEDASPFLSATTATWVNATTFRQTYLAQNYALNTTTVDVAVDGAKDTLGVSQQTGFQADVFDVRLYTGISPTHVLDIQGTLLPDNVPVTFAGAGHVITAADVGKTVKFIVRYTIPTDDNGCFGQLNYMCPELVFTNAGGAVPRSLTNVTAIWLTRTRYSVTWTIADGDEQFDSIDIKVAGGVGRADDPSNKNTDTQLTGVFSIDTKHPTVTAVTSSDTAITATSPASGLVTLTVAFSHAMDTASAPSLSFPNQALGSALTPTGGTWTDSTHYAQTLRVSGAGIDFARVDVKVSGARKATSGNLQREGTVAGVFGISLQAAPPPLASLTPLILSIPNVNLIPGSVWDASCCSDIFVRVLSRALSTPLSLVGHSPSGTVVLDGFQGGRLAFLVTGMAMGDVRDEGLYAMGDGQYQVVSGGVAATIVPTLVDVGQLANLLPQGSTVQMTANGVLTATIDGVTYVVQPGVAVQRLVNADAKASIAKGSDGYLHFMDAAGNRQTLYPAFLEPQTLRNYLRAIDGRASLVVQLDGTATVVLQGKSYVLLPDLTLSALPSNLPVQGWLQNGTQHFLYLNQQHPNTTQGLGFASK